MNAFELFDRRSFATKMEMAMVILARKRPRPSQEEQAEAFQPVLDYIIEAMGKPSQPTQAVKAAPADTELDRPLRQDERITPQSLDQIFQETAPHINAMLQKIDEVGLKTMHPQFNVIFNKNEGMFVQELPMYLDREGSKYIFIANEGFNPQNGWVVKIGKR